MESVKKFIVDYIQRDYTIPDDINIMKMNYVEEGYIDSLGLIQFIAVIEDEFGIRMSRSGNLTKWAKQGVLLLNNVLTVRAGLANSHRNQGWEIFTDEVIRLLNVRKEPVIFVFWGNNAKAKMQLVTNPIHLVLTSAHPSPLSAYNGFFGCGHFRKINEFLMANGKSPIDWQI